MRRLAILDMNNAVPNQGMRCLREIAAQFSDRLHFDTFDVRAQNELPDLSYDIYLSSGGPGSPLPEGRDWEAGYFRLIDRIVAHNQEAAPHERKFVFFVCHSFQMACHHFEVGEIAPRGNRSFGVLPVFKTGAGSMESLFDPLPDPFYAVDVRDFQVINIDYDEMHRTGMKLLALEQPREKPMLPRAAMAVRFTDELVGTQFHPEADPEGMHDYYSQEAKRRETIDTYGLKVYNDIIEHLNDPDKVELTHTTLIPGFIESALAQLSPVAV